MFSDGKSSGSRPLNSVFYYHIPGTPLTLYVRDIGDRLPFDDIHASLESLEVFFVRQIAVRGDGPSLNRVTRHGTVQAAFHPVAMTWTTAVEVVDALETIMANDNWTWSSHVTVIDATLQQTTVGYLTISYRAPGTLSASRRNVDFQPP